jgi:uncharacterized membrane protein YozB (DUF420 family)
MQRKQSLWFFLSALLVLLTFFLPYGVQQAPGATTEVMLTAKNNVLTAVLSVLAAVFGLALIFLHGTRSRQRKLSLVLFLVYLLVAAYMLYDAQFSGDGKKFIVGVYNSSLFIGILLPICSAVLAIMGYNGIRNDEKLIASMDRLR